jgi:hypothetical protein
MRNISSVKHEPLSLDNETLVHGRGHHEIEPTLGHGYDGGLDTEHCLSTDLKSSSYLESGMSNSMSSTRQSTPFDDSSQCQSSNSRSSNSSVHRSLKALGTMNDKHKAMAKASTHHKHLAADWLDGTLEESKRKFATAEAVSVIPASPSDCKVLVNQQSDETRMQELAPAAAPRESQTLLLCVGDESADYWDIGNGQEISTVRFSSTASFNHWLFSQSRGDITPWAVLVVGWREAKPCAMAIAAAISGDVRGLRPDAQRPELKPVLRHYTSTTMVRVAVDTMLIISGHKQGQMGKGQTGVYPKWALSDEMRQLDIFLVANVKDLSEQLETLRRTIRL